MIINILGKGYVTNEVSTVLTCEANLNEENRIKFVTDLAAISRGKHESNNPAVRYKQLLKEAAPNVENKPSRKCPKCGSDRYIIKTNYNDMLVIGTKESVYVDTTIACNDCRYNENHYDITNIWIEPTNDLTGTPSRPLEFLPVVLKVKMDCLSAVITNAIITDEILATPGESVRIDFINFVNKIIKYSYVTDTFWDNPCSADLLIYTNMRACLNAGISYDNIPYNTAEELKDFRAIRIKAPMFVFNHLVTHTALSKEARSERVTELVNTDYWLPKDFREKVYTYVEANKDDSVEIIPTEDDSLASTARNRINVLKLGKIILSCNNRDDIIKFLLSGNELAKECKPFNPPDISQQALQDFFKTIGYPKEIYQRAMLEFRYKEFIMTGWGNNPATWLHLITERNGNPEIWKNWTQPETKEVVTAIKQVIL